MTLTQDTLFALDTPEPPNPAKTTPRISAHRAQPRRDTEDRAMPCNPTCLTCGQPTPEDQTADCIGTLPVVTPCATVCRHVGRPAVAEVCVVTTRVTAVADTSPHSGRTIALVLCPFCGEVHHHAATYGVRYRISACGRPYVVHLPRPRLTPGGTA
ncbi:hypothetical protein [Microbispora sp. GKU 823]|uniref:hypothetical protein n=1 Tax=Microbispora sp. GKU 823 TaxID=1652100 RepID=UPI0009A26D8F|nr:hypothetical protein [Microbispora sp. GKU 823]OPG13673.1 hypothetical protein B1L11_06715 [Microbispora sp. GKU 823]